MPVKSVILGKFPLRPPDEICLAPRFLQTKCKVRLSDSNSCKMFQNTRFCIYDVLCVVGFFYYYFFFPPKAGNLLVYCFREMEERNKKDDNILWWRLTCRCDDQPYKILDSHNRPQRSHKIIIASVLIILIL